MLDAEGANVSVANPVDLHDFDKPASIEPPKYVIVTAYYKETREILERCLKSVQAQNIPVDHIVVADGFPQDWIDKLPVRHMRLDRAHQDFGNTPRGIGALLAISEGYEGIGFLDADNWLEDKHVASCVATGAQAADTDFVIARWNLRRPDNSIIAAPHNPTHVDTNCFFFLPGSYYMLPHFNMMHRNLSMIGDKIFYRALQAVDLKSATVDAATVNYNCLWPEIYRLAGEAPPPQAKEDLDTAPLMQWVESLPPREKEIVAKRAGWVMPGTGQRKR